MRVPKHIGIIPDGNRRWAVNVGLSKEKGYDYGLRPGLDMFRLCKEAGVQEITYYGFTTDNTKRPKEQTKAFTKACIKAVEMLSNEDASLLVVGNINSPKFPKELKHYTKRRKFGEGDIKVNFLVNYGWHWDLENLFSYSQGGRKSKANIMEHIYTSDISRVDLIIRWGGRRRLSGFLPVQSIYADFYVIDDLWPDFKPEHFHEALKWYDSQDITLGG
ncbi:polyprenyl diphosphate synthase [Paramaledivibacter caminithermalis]|jgi:undecaprenyl diphosphate synthase|uniref:Undecaprenyl diphosphate synthase n=1 Tax=Paramaledivibacter caminithermalis (strain DSM 15212 / CIP 107654 / DViRD3) TaxID=1121301 RepID=A0A1M6S5N1_PARC5|nr:polyprenyl diphosphate synthase [Paramaledivibacter caminithermalis]SHK39981.1 undecaprenyl diphosphate synthase [Paramaledivibacter caminithermalis DSM 15212]